MSKETYTPNFNNYVATEIWEDNDRLTLIYNHLEGAGHIVTNYYSDTYFQIISGEGKLATPSVGVLLQAGDVAHVRTGIQHQTLGDMTYFMTLVPGIHPELITFGGQTLGRAQKKLLQRIDHAERKQGRVEQRARIMQEIVEKYVGRLDDVLALQYAHSKDTLHL